MKASLCGHITDSVLNKVISIKAIGVKFKLSQECKIELEQHLATIEKAMKDCNSVRHSCGSCPNKVDKSKVTIKKLIC